MYLKRRFIGLKIWEETQDYPAQMTFPLPLIFIPLSICWGTTTLYITDHTTPSQCVCVCVYASIPQAWQGSRRAVWSQALQWGGSGGSGGTGLPSSSSPPAAASPWTPWRPGPAFPWRLQLDGPPTSAWLEGEVGYSIKMNSFCLATDKQRERKWFRT